MQEHDSREREAMARGTQLISEGQHKFVGAQCQQFLEVMFGQAIQIRPEIRVLTFYPVALFAANFCVEARPQSSDDWVLQRAAKFAQRLHQRLGEDRSLAGIKSVMKLLSEEQYSGGQRPEKAVVGLGTGLLMFVGGAKLSGIGHAWEHMPAFFFKDEEPEESMH